MSVASDSDPRPPTSTAAYPTRRILWGALGGLLLVIQIALLVRMWLDQDRLYVEQRRLAARVAQLETSAIEGEKRGRGRRHNFSANGSSLPGRNAPNGPEETQPQADLLARLVILELYPQQTLTPQQAQSIRGILSSYGNGPQDEAATRGAREQVDAVMTAGQRKFLEEHADQVESKSAELNKILGHDEGSLVDLMQELLKGKGGG